MNEHRYILEPYKGMNTRYHCPECNKREKTFTRYIDKETGEHLAPSVGRCNRESNCGYHLTPKQYFENNGFKNEFQDRYAHGRARAKCSVVTPLLKPVSFIPVEVFKASLYGHEKNNFVKFLIDNFGVEVASKLISQYFIGTSKFWNGATVFWQIDTQGKIRTGKIMLYSPDTGKRIKEPHPHINWVHSVLKQPEFELRQCLFGEHLINQFISKPVAIVESEKTALIASVYLPQFLWLAVGSLTNLNAEKCSILKGRTITLFPDLNGFEKWSEKAKELSQLATFTVSDLLERKASETERKQGFDLADYLIKFDFKEFALPEPEPLSTPKPPAVQSIVSDLVFPTECFTITAKPEFWEQEISELEKYFSGITLPTQPVKLNQCSTIKNVSLFIESHFATVKTNNGNITFLPHLNRLQELKEVLTANFN